jgi:hypothetical protein
MANNYLNLIIFISVIITQITSINSTKVCYNVSSCDFGWSCNPYSGSCANYCETGCEYINTGFTRNCFNITQSDTKKEVICPTGYSYDINTNKCNCFNTTTFNCANKCPNNCIYNSKTKQCVLENLNNTFIFPSIVCEPYIYITCLVAPSEFDIYSLNITSIPTYYQNMERGINNISRCSTNGYIIMYPVRFANDYNNIKCKYSPGNGYKQKLCNTYSEVCCNMS